MALDSELIQSIEDIASYTGLSLTIRPHCDSNPSYSATTITLRTSEVQEFYKLAINPSMEYAFLIVPEEHDDFLLRDLCNLVLGLDIKNALVHPFNLVKRANNSYNCNGILIQNSEKNGCSPNNKLVGSMVAALGLVMNTVDIPKGANVIQSDSIGCLDEFLSPDYEEEDLYYAYVTITEEYNKISCDPENNKSRMILLGQALRRIAYMTIPYGVNDLDVTKKVLRIGSAGFNAWLINAKRKYDESFGSKEDLKLLKEQEALCSINKVYTPKSPAYSEKAPYQLSLYKKRAS